MSCTSSAQTGLWRIAMVLQDNPSPRRERRGKPNVPRPGVYCRPSSRTAPWEPAAGKGRPPSATGSHTPGFAAMTDTVNTKQRGVVKFAFGTVIAGIVITLTVRSYLSGQMA